MLCPCMSANAVHIATAVTAKIAPTFIVERADACHWILIKTKHEWEFDWPTNFNSILQVINYQGDAGMSFETYFQLSACSI